jgi:hypothetical protein
MDLNRLIKKIYGESVFITGGSGESIQSSIKLHNVSTLQSTNVEEFVLDFLLDLQECEYRLVVLEMINIANNNYDKITLEVRCRHTSRTFKKIYYFNITGCRAVDLAFDYSSSGIKRSNK